MKSATPPTPPDPAKTAAAQTQSNKDTAGYQQEMNLIDQITPLGSLTYNQTGTGSTGAPRYTATTALTPSGQKSFDLQQAVSEALNNLALKGSGQVSNAFDKPQSYDNLPDMQGLDFSKLTEMTGFDPSKLGVDAPNSLDLSKLKDLPTGLDTSKLGDSPVADEASRQKAEDALYGLNTSRLDPQFEQDQKRLETQLINKGVRQGSEAWNQAIGQFTRGRTDAYDNARKSSIAGAADYERNLFDMSKSAYDTRLNTAQTGFQDDLAAHSAGLDTSVKDFTAKQQARQNAVAEALSQSQVSQAQRNQGISEQQALAGNAAQRRQQGITESNYLRELPINEISSLLNGGQVNMPQFSNTPQTNVAGTDVAGIIQNDFQNQYGIYKQKQASNDALTGAVFSLAGSALGGWATGGFA
jgi:hypothetical protein